MLVITIGNEILFRWTRKQEDKLVAPAGKIITEDEFEKMVKNGDKVCILDDIVLNLETYAYSHPGGAFLIEYTVGRDISKFFFGSYALDGNNSKPGSENNSHAHSNIARKIANRHAIGYL
jgi:cytochrome b involved in lipid metabolism